MAREDGWYCGILDKGKRGDPLSSSQTHYLGNPDYSSRNLIVSKAEIKWKRKRIYVR